jgi:acyl transferase domain-containing protein|tara:strand:- start:679 stop:936 length:258 start_codon:yes stop_codon:yes gene_type:complete
MNKNQVDNWREVSQIRLEELTVVNAKQSSEISHIKETVDEIKTLVKEQNGRVRTLESSVSSMQSVGSFLAVVMGSLIGWLYKGDA